MSICRFGSIAVVRLVLNGNSVLNLKRTIRKKKKKHFHDYKTACRGVCDQRFWWDCSIVTDDDDGLVCRYCFVNDECCCCRCRCGCMCVIAVAEEKFRLLAPASGELKSLGSDSKFKTFVAVFADEAKSNVWGGSLWPSIILMPPPAPANTLMAALLLIVDPVVATDVTEVSTNCCRFLNSDDLKLVDRLSLEANDVDKGELRSTDEATSIKVWCLSKYMNSNITSLNMCYLFYRYQASNKLAPEL